VSSREVERGGVSRIEEVDRRLIGGGGMKFKK